MHIIDSHFHILSPNKEKLLEKFFIQQNIPKPNFSISGCRSDRLLSLPLKYIVAFPFPFQDINIDEENNYVISLSKKMKKILPVCILDKKSEFWINEGALAIKEHYYGMRLETKYESYHESYKTLEKLNIPLITHLGVKGYPDVSTYYTKIYNRVFDLKNKFPKLKILIAHAGMNFIDNSWCDEWHNFLQKIIQLSSDIVIDTSMVTDSNTIQKIFTFFPDQRILFGSDYPYSNVLNSVSKIQNFVNKNQKELFFHNNAYNFFRLSEKELDTPTGVL